MPDVSDTLFRSATDAARLLGQKEISARELTEALLARIDAVNPAINAVVELRADDALQEAAAADRTVAAGARLGPLHGVPMTVKDSFDVAGLHTTWGNPEFADYVAETDATLVRRLKDAGAIVVGKTNVHFMLADFGQTANDLYGVTNNPWDTGRTPGGSSGGGAAPLAAGLTFLEYGSDLVGSIRIPGELLWRLRTQAERRRRAADGFPGSGDSAEPTGADVHVRARAAFTIGARFAARPRGYGRSRAPSEQGLRMAARTAASYTP
jgi:hypothetical protein